ncbi:MAG: hypothetical protein H7242_19415 [Microbacteriaceae bacterium]|nr:hypothetical protein [Burkholderiaceae bacterium]
MANEWKGLANILLDQLDRELQWRGHRFARHADDMIILVKSEHAAQRVMQSITRCLEQTLKLKVNSAKSKLAPMREYSFLSFTIKGKKIRWTDKALAHFKLEAGVSNAWLKRQGLISVNDLWCKAHGDTT